MDSHFINYVDLEMTLIFDPGIKINVTGELF